MGGLNGKKTQILIAHQKEDIEWTQKSTATRQKKFGKLTTPYGMFEWKKLKFFLLIRRKI